MKYIVRHICFCVYYRTGSTNKFLHRVKSLSIYINEQKFYIFESLDSENVLIWYSNGNIFNITSVIDLETMLEIAKNLTFR